MDWKSQTPKPDCNHLPFYSDCLEAFSDCLLEQMVTSPIRGQNILDLFFTSNPTLVNKVTILHCLSDHDIILAEVNSRPEVIKQVPRDILLYKKADWDQLKQSIRQQLTELQSDPAITDSQTLWAKFAGRLQQAIDEYIPTRKVGIRDGFLWINQEIRRLIRKRDKLYKRWSRSGRPDDQKKFLDQKHLVWRVSDQANKKYLQDILGINDDTDDPDTPSKVKTKKTVLPAETFKAGLGGISLLKANGKTFSEDSDKVNALNGQFNYVFSPKSPTSIKQLAQRTLQDLHDSVINLPFQPSTYPQCLISKFLSKALKTSSKT